MKRLTRIAAAALLGLSLTSPALAKGSCYTDQDVREMQVRQLHYELMVAALKCHSGEDDFRTRWSSYVDRFGPAMTANASHLRALFVRMGKGQAGMDRFVTQLTNDASGRAQYIPDYCGTQAKLFEAVMEVNPGEVGRWVGDKVERPVPASTTCAAIAAVKEPAPKATAVKVKETKTKDVPHAAAKPAKDGVKAKEAKAQAPAVKPSHQPEKG